MNIRQRTAEILSMSLFALLLLWGGYSVLVYLGVPVHGSVLLPSDWQGTVTEMCPEGGLLCRGWYSFAPSIMHSIGRLAPFLWYFVLSFVLFGAWIGSQAILRPTGAVSVRLRPWLFPLLFFLCTWLLFTVMAAGSVGDQPVSRLFEPLPQVYSGASANELETLQESFKGLQERGCLTQIGQTDTGVGVYDVRMSCMQGAFFTRVMPQMLLVGFLLFNFLVFGSLLLSLLKYRPQNRLVELMLSTLLGSCGLIVILWLLGVVGFVSPLTGWVTLVAVPLISYREVLRWGKWFLSVEHELEGPWYNISIFLAWLLISYLALNFLSVIRPFPIGWDDLGSYLNRPRLFISYGTAIPTMATFQWEYLTSLGFWLFGYESVVGATAAMVINWLAGLLAVGTILVFARTYLGKGGIIAALTYYTLPLVGHFSFADMKVDNAVFAMGAAAMLCLFLALFPQTEQEEEGEVQTERDVRRLLILAGLFAGFAFAMKATAIMVIVASLAVIVGLLAGIGAMIGTAVIGFAVFIYQGSFDVGRFLSRMLEASITVNHTLTFILLFTIGLVLIGVGLMLRRDRMVILGQRAGIYVLAVLIAVTPWLVRNNILRGNIIPRVELGAPNSITPLLVTDGTKGPENPGRPVRALPPELAVDKNHPLCQGTAASEELDRYWGFDQGVGHYLTLPWRTVMNLDSGGYYVTTGPALLLFPLLLLLPFFWFTRGKWLRWLFVATSLLLVQWMILANGVPWYGIGMFLGLAVGLEVFIAKSPDLPNRVLASVFIGLSILMSLAMRTWQFETQRNLYEYALGKVTAEAMQERTIPNYDHIRDVLLDRADSMKERPYTYRMGTFIPYFIPRNLELLPISDNQLDYFQCLHQEGNNALTLKRLQALGFNAIIFDTNTATIESDQNGTLHQKVNKFVEWVNDASLGLRLEVNDLGNGIAYILLP